MTPGTVPLLLWSALVVAAAESEAEREMRGMMEEQREMRDLMEEQVRALMEEQMRALMEEQRGMRALMEEQMRALMEEQREMRALMEEQMRALMEEQMALMEEQRGMRALMEEQRGMRALMEEQRGMRALMEEQMRMRALMEEQMRALMEEQMRALMEEQRVELRHTKAQLDTMETRLRASEKLVQQLRSDIAGNLNLTGSQMEREERRVAFSASLITSGHVSVGPANTNLTLIYRNVITNIGDAYNNKTGIFTAPVRGVYYFTMFIYGSGHNWVSVGGSLSKNKEHVVIAYCHLPHGKASASNGASLLLEVGDQVFVILYTDSWVRDSYNHHTSISGHLLFPM
ncbi:involucrin-like isoform X2 [Alosa sapidissima]|uniref:involucrin-like isoform X2 n=1 Tax=Alosa sapidissima TaxID=34773 RepID=UPI001C08B685|nr:involucrin-like isoform X2 [Alosa sapidissima]